MSMYTIDQHQTNSHYLSASVVSCQHPHTGTLPSPNVLHSRLCAGESRNSAHVNAAVRNMCYFTPAMSRSDNFLLRPNAKEYDVNLTVSLLTTYSHLFIHMYIYSSPLTLSFSHSRAPSLFSLRYLTMLNCCIQQAKCRQVVPCCTHTTSQSVSHNCFYYTSKPECQGNVTKAYKVQQRHHMKPHSPSTMVAHAIKIRPTKSEQSRVPVSVLRPLSYKDHSDHTDSVFISRLSNSSSSHRQIYHMHIGWWYTPCLSASSVLCHHAYIGI
jgi:hypothetical protein